MVPEDVRLREWRLMSLPAGNAHAANRAGEGGGCILGHDQ